MPQTFQITISAVDKATATVRKINDSISKITRPFDQAGKSFKSLGREIGFDKIGKDIAKIGDFARGAARDVGTLGVGLGALTGISTVTGIVALASSWSKLGRSITYSAQNIGIGTSQLQAWQGAAKIAGLSADAMTDSLNTLGKTMEDAQWGRNPDAFGLSRILHIGLRRKANGQFDVGGEMLAIADAIKRQRDPQQQAKIAETFGISSMLPLLRQGSKAIREYEADAARAGYVMSPGQLADANKFADSLAKVDLSVEALKNSLGSALLPAIKPVVDQFEKWTTANQALITSKVDQYAKDLGKWFESVDWKEIGKDITKIFHDIDKVVNALGGVKGVLIEIAAYKSLTLFGDIAISLVRIGALTKAMFGLRDAAKAATAAEAAAAAGGAAGAGGGLGAAAKGGLLSKLLGGASFLSLFRAAMFAPRPADSRPITQQLPWLANGANEGYWQRWSDLFHWRAPEASRPMGGNAQTRGIRNNNPGNIIYGDFARKLGATGADARGFAIFPTAQQGLDAIAANLRSYGHKGYDTPYEIAHRWSTTDQDAYTRRLANLFGGDPNRQLDMTDPAVISALRGGIITQENGSNPYQAPAGPYSRGVAGERMAAGKLHLDVKVSAPPGVQVRATPSDNTTANVRIASPNVGMGVPVA